MNTCLSKNSKMSYITSSVLLCCSVIFLQPNDASDGCNFLINELNTDTPGNIKNLDFIELKVVCDYERRSSNLQGFKVIGITVSSDLQKKNK